MENQKIKSRYKIFGGFGLLLVMCIVISILYFYVLKSQLQNNVDIESWLSDQDEIIAFVVLSLLELLFLTLFSSENKYIIIENEEITFINPILPFIRKTRPFSDYDYFFITMEQSRSGEYEAVWLMKNNRLKTRISSFYYSNYNELKDSLNVRNRGERKMNPFLQLFYLFGLKIND